MVTIHISEKLKSHGPDLRLACIEAGVHVQRSSEELLTEINRQIQVLNQSLRIGEISKIPAVSASRKAYKLCGKDPARYRLSAEALLRRVVSGKGLYQINNVVDQLNLVSISSGFSIGGYDLAKIQGDITFGIGQNDEPYSGIGRGELNIENMPVFRDDLGAFGTPTSDSQRTEVTDFTTRFLMILIDFDRNSRLEETQEMAIRCLTNYCYATNINTSIMQ
ncbi:MAG: phenylalanine--tRNA ligase beta subunit-related protein [Prolixibacteraceae bacterium]|jgi:DNA/RNA-binding domain of Phe-tRNA-synthetase-like protein